MNLDIIASNINNNLFSILVANVCSLGKPFAFLFGILFTLLFLTVMTILIGTLLGKLDFDKKTNEDDSTFVNSFF